MSAIPNVQPQQPPNAQTPPPPGTTPNFAPQEPVVAPGGGQDANSGGAPQSQSPPQLSAPPQDPRTVEEQADRELRWMREAAVNQLMAQLDMDNVAEKLDKQVLMSIGIRVVEDYEIDRDSRRDWLEQNREAVELARLIGKVKTYGEGVVANVKYPTLAIAAIQFAARAYPNIINGDQVVKGKKFGRDDDAGTKQKRADRMAAFMSWQLLQQMDNWDEETDQLLVILPVVGCVFRKTYRDHVNKKNVSEMCPAEDLVVNYFAKSLERVPHFTQHVVLYPNEIVERVRGKKFLDREFGEPVSHTEVKQNQDTRDKDKPHLFLEQHRWWDIDGDGYQEPYVVTVHYDTQQVVRIVPRYDSDGIHTNDDGEIVRITPRIDFTRYLFFPSFDGGFYGMGFGALIGPINKTVNTNLNQLLDAGTMANRQCGFLGKGVRLPEGTKSLRFKHGEWKYVDSTGDDLRKNVFPLPANPPSEVLFKLLQFMVEAAKELASNADVLSGNQPAANVPATTTLALIEQGLKVYSSIYLRIHKSLSREFKKLKYLDKLFVEADEYQRVLDDPDAVMTDFYDSDLDITPVSDIGDLNDMQKVMKAQALKECIDQGLNDREIYRRYFAALNIPDVETILDAPEPKTDPRIEIEQIKAQLKQTEMALKEKEIEYRHELDTARAAKLQSDSALVDQRAAGQQFEREITALKFELEKERQALEAALKAQDQGHRQTMEVADHHLEHRKLDIKERGDGDAHP